LIESFPHVGINLRAPLVRSAVSR